MKVKSESEVAQLCLTLRDPMDCSLPGSSAHGIFQAREYWSGVPSPSLKHTLQESKLEQGFPGEPVVKNSSANAGEWAQSLLQEDPLEQEMVTHFSTLARKIPWTESVVGYSPWGCKESDMTERLHFLSLFSQSRFIICTILQA